MLNDVECDLLQRFDSAMVLAAVRALVNFRANILDMRSDEQMVRLEACNNFFPNPPAAKTGRKTLRPITQIRKMAWKLVQDWPLLGADNPERLVQKFEYANNSINQRMV
jgi:hypothetical protein